MKYIEVCRCPIHQEFWALMISDESGGVRLTRSKCCGRWDVVKRWPLYESFGREIINEIECALDPEAPND